MAFFGRERERPLRHQAGPILGSLPVDLVFIDGNHDNHTELRAPEISAEGLATVLPRIKYLPRAGHAVFQGLSVGGLGGAFSVDHAFKKTGVDWWLEIEEVEQRDVERLIAGRPLDVLLAHDALFPRPWTVMTWFLVSHWRPMDARHREADPTLSYLTKDRI